MPLLAKGRSLPRPTCCGAYRPQTEYARYWLQWRKVAVVARILLLVALTQRGVHLHQLAEQDKALKAEIRQVHHPDLPGGAGSSTSPARWPQHLKSLGLAPRTGSCCC